MPVTRYCTLLGAVVIAATLSLLYGLIRGASAFIMPYLFWSAIAALVISASGYLIATRYIARRQPCGFYYFVAGTVLVLCFALLDGVFITAAENIAEHEARRIGRRGDNGYHDFYPGDSGMSHWPTKWHEILTGAGITFPVWGAALFLLMAYATRLDTHCEQRLQTNAANGA
jgi:hypothetical protein